MCMKPERMRQSSVIIALSGWKEGKQCVKFSNYCLIQLHTLTEMRTVPQWVKRNCSIASFPVVSNYARNLVNPRTSHLITRGFCLSEFRSSSESRITEREFALLTQFLKCFRKSDIVKIVAVLSSVAFWTRAYFFFLRATKGCWDTHVAGKTLLHGN